MVALRTVFDKHLRMLENDVLRLAELVETQLHDAVKALQEHNFEAARRVDGFDSVLNKLRYEIEEQAYTLLALQQPTASDMRRIVSTVSIATNLERMGDHAAGIARLTLRLEDKPAVVYMPVFADMAFHACQNLRSAVDALSKGDAALARATVRRDAVIDEMHKNAYDQLIQTMMAQPSTVEYATALLWVSHHIERYGDRVCNICERIIYAATGSLFEPRVDMMP